MSIQYIEIDGKTMEYLDYKNEQVKDKFVKGKKMNEIKSGCGNCWFCWNGQCLYAPKCGGSKKWSNILNSFVPITYIEKTDNRGYFMKDKEKQNFEFKVIDKKTGKEADIGEIALKEDWAKSLMYCDMQGFAITEDNHLILLDECGKYEFCPSDRFEYIPGNSVMLSREEIERLSSSHDIVFCDNKNCSNNLLCRCCEISECPKNIPEYNEKLSANKYKLELFQKLCKERERADSWEDRYKLLEEELKQASKETAEKILNELYCTPREQVENKIKDLARFIGVEIKE